MSRANGRERDQTFPRNVSTGGRKSRSSCLLFLVRRGRMAFREKRRRRHATEIDTSGGYRATVASRQRRFDGVSRFAERAGPLRVRPVPLWLDRKSVV